MSSKVLKQKKSLGCITSQCANKIQAVCFTCRSIFCFKCSLIHASSNSSIPHNMLQLQDSITQLSKESKKLQKQFQQLIKQAEGFKDKYGKEDQNWKLSPEKFQEQLDQVNFMKKQTIKVVEKFFSEISLQLVNIWEVYLKKFSNSQDFKQNIQQLRAKIQKFENPWQINDTKQQIIRDYFQQNFSNKLQSMKKVVSNKVKQPNSSSLIPKCPQIRIDDRVLVLLSQVLCGSISTQNYSLQKSENPLSIVSENYLHKSVSWLPIFPIKKSHCFLYNLQKKNYQIQQFQQLQYIPDYPKTIIIPNGDIHIVGGTKNQHVVDTHLVFRASSSQVFKLANLPIPRNPANSLLYYNKSIYLIGGINQKHQWDNRCFRYFLQTKQWKEIASMNNSKPHQSCSLFNDSIYTFGIPQHKKINIQCYQIQYNKWSELCISNFLSNPFNFAAGFISLQINPSQILLFGGKRFLQSASTNKRSTDRTLQQNVYVFQPETNSFLLKGPLYPCLGVQYGQFYPIVHNQKIYTCEYVLCKTNPISRWYDNLQILQISPNGAMESVILLQQQ